MSDKNRELELECDRVVGVQDAPKRWVAKVEARPRYNRDTGEREPDLIMGHVVEDGDEIALVHGIDESIAVRTNLMAAAPDLLSELKLAHGIIANALNLMPKEQKLAWDEANERDGLKDGMAMTRHNARRAVIAKAEGRSE